MESKQYITRNAFTFVFNCHGTNLYAYVTTVVCAVRGLRPVAYYTLSCPLFSFVVNQVF